MKSAYELLQPSDIAACIDGGYRVLDPHLHTSASHDVFPSSNVSPRTLYAHMRANGWGLVAFTDHDTLDAYREFPEQPDRLVRAVEIKIRPSRIGEHTRTHTLHVNVYMLTDHQFDDLEKIATSGDFYAFIDYLKSQRLRYSLNHPFWHEQAETPNWDIIPEVLRNGCFPLTEYNWARLPQQNALVLEMARHLGVPVWGASDNHVGKPEFATLVKGETFEEAWDHVIAGQARIVRQHLRTPIGQAVAIYDASGYQDYIVDIVARAGRQLIDVTPADLQRKALTIQCGSWWRDSLVRLVTHEKINRAFHVTDVLGRLIVAHHSRFGRLFARPYIRSQLAELEAIAAVVQPCELPTNCLPGVSHLPDEAPVAITT